jgi:hypothetical protein
MPEFSAVTLLRPASHELLGRKIRRTELTYVSGYRWVRLAAMDSWDPARPLEMLAFEDRVGASLPLALALSFLAEAVADPDWPLGARVRERVE